MLVQPFTARHPREREMGDEVAGGEPLGPPLATRLKLYFDGLTQGPVPDHLLQLTEALEVAFERGDLKCGRRSAS